MFRTKMSLTAVVLTGGAVLFGTPTAAQEFKGQVKIGMHKVSLEPNKLYEIILEGPKDQPLSVTSQGIQLKTSNAWAKAGG